MGSEKDHMHNEHEKNTRRLDKTITMTNSSTRWQGKTTTSTQGEEDATTNAAMTGKEEIAWMA